jgi:hypothetical protein
VTRVASHVTRCADVSICASGEEAAEVTSHALEGVGNVGGTVMRLAPTALARKAAFAGALGAADIDVSAEYADTLTVRTRLHRRSNSRPYPHAAAALLTSRTRDLSTHTLSLLCSRPEVDPSLV